MKTVPPLIAAIACSAALLPCSSFAQGQSPAIEGTPTLEDLARFFSVRSWKSVIPLQSRSYTASLYHFEGGKLGERLVPSPAPRFELPESNLTIIAGHENGFYKLALDLGTGMGLMVKTPVPVFEAEVPHELPAKLAVGDYVLFGVARDDFKEGDKPSIQTYKKGILLRVEEFKGAKGA